MPNSLTNLVQQGLGRQRWRGGAFVCFVMPVHMAVHEGKYMMSKAFSTSESPRYPTVGGHIR
jgi:hypothetical protein